MGNFLEVLKVLKLLKQSSLVRFSPLCSSYTHFLTVAILELSKKGIHFVTTVAF